MTDLPLKGLIVVEFSQYLSAPSAALRLADLGARVIKIEKPKGGDAGRKLAIKNLWADDSSLLFHTINRNKESFTADLKNADDLDIIKRIVEKADVLIHNFRPGVMEKIGLGYTVVKTINERIVYAEISGYGKEGPWKNKPGQDLLLQSLTGLTYTTGNGDNGPVPFGIAIGDILAGAQLVQGILAALIRRQKTNQGALIEVSLIETLIDFQFELFTTYFASNQQPQRSIVNNGQPLLSAPYGIYKTGDGYMALAMMDIHELAEAIHCNELYKFSKNDVFSERDNIKTVLVSHLKKHPSQYWMEKLHDSGLWAMEVLDWEKMMKLDAYQVLEMEQAINVNGKEITTTRCPIRINGEKLYAMKPAPYLGGFTGSLDDARARSAEAQTLTAARYAESGEVPVSDEAWATSRPGARPLVHGSKGDDVQFLQYLTGRTPDGIYGPETEEAVRYLRTRHGIPDPAVTEEEAVVWCDRDFWAAILPARTLYSLSQGDAGFRIRVLQAALAAYDWAEPHLVSGRFGVETAKAVRRMQANHNLRITGRVRNAEWVVLVDSPRFAE